jgi:gliding motility-associated-like protein
VGNNLVAVVATLQGCASDTSNVITIIGDEIPEQNANAGADVAFCPGEILILHAGDPAPGTGVWSTADSMVIFENETNPNTEILPLPSGEYTFYWTLSYATCLNYSTDSVVLTLITTPIAQPDTVEVPFGQTAEFSVLPNDSIVNAYTVQIGTSPLKGNALHAGDGIFRYTPNIGFVGTDMMTYIVCSVDCPEECSETTVILHVGNESDCFVPTLFTPNDDGINDMLIVPCLETSRYPNNRIIIFNEWGDAVFTASPYENNWDGKLSGDPLPVGTYFYIMDFGDGNTPKRSFLVLER